MSKRKIIKIDESKCNGCALCILNCKEGAIQIIDGKARLVSDVFCDGLGACLGHCPQGAITIEEREAMDFDEEKVKARETGEGCQLKTWPVQIKLVPVMAPFLEDSDLLIAADCVAFTYADFHQKLLKGKVCLVGCPKLDDIQPYQEKLKQIMKINKINSVTYAHMEVPCCLGLLPVIKQAIAASGKDIFFEEVIISIKGERLWP